MNASIVETTTTPPGDPDELLPTDAAAELLTQLLGYSVTPRALESWRTDARRAQPLQYVRSLGRVRYKRSDLQTFATSMLASKLPESLQEEHLTHLLQAPVFSRDATPAEHEHCHWLLRAAGPQARRVDAGLAGVRLAMQKYFDAALHQAAEAMALDRAAAACGGVLNVTRESLLDAIRSLTAELNDQRASWKSTAERAKQLLVDRAARLQQFTIALGEHSARLGVERLALTHAIQAFQSQACDGAHEAGRKTLAALGFEAAAVEEFIAHNLPHELVLKPEAQADAARQRIAQIDRELAAIESYSQAPPGGARAEMFADIPALARLIPLHPSVVESAQDGGHVEAA